MGDMIFFIPPVLETIKRVYPDCHITFVTAWGFKDTKGRWGKRNQDGFCLALMMSSPHIDQLVHYHDTKLSLDGSLCQEEGRSFPTWNQAYYATQKNSGEYDDVFELDMGIGHTENPLERMYDAVGLPDEEYSNYQLYLTEADKAVAAQVMQNLPHPRIVLLEGLEGTTTRGWDPGKLPALTAAITAHYGVAPIWFGGKHTREWRGRSLTLRENIATLLYADVAIGVLSGPLHFAAAVGLPTITLYADAPLHRTAPAYFLNRYVTAPKRKHRTILGPSGSKVTLLKHDGPSPNLTTVEAAAQGGINWRKPGKQATKTGLAVITVSEVCAVLQDVL